MLSGDYFHNPAVRPFGRSAVRPFLDRLRALGIPWQFGTNEPAAFLAGHGWDAQIHDFDVVGRRWGRWPPPGVSEEVAARAAVASRSFFISARRALTA